MPENPEDWWRLGQIVWGLLMIGLLRVIGVELQALVGVVANWCHYDIKRRNEE